MSHEGRDPNATAPVDHDAKPPPVAETAAGDRLDETQAPMAVREASRPPTSPLPPAPRSDVVIREADGGPLPPPVGLPKGLPPDALVLGPYSGPVSSKAARAFRRGARAPWLRRDQRVAILIGAGFLLFAATFGLTLLWLRR